MEITGSDKWAHYQLSNNIDLEGKKLLDIGGQYLNIETYVLYDSNEVQNPICGKWQTFKRNIKADFNKPFVRWKDIEFMIFFVEVENSEFGSLNIYVDNIQTVEALTLRRFLNNTDRNR